ncbi:unnamed protein product [Mucor hiemalis]
MNKNSATTTATFTSVPIYKTGSYQNRTTQSPPTPTSSNSSSTLEKGKGRDLTSVQIPYTSQKYGSLGSSAPYFETLGDSRPVTPSQTTIGSNDNDEGLYLLWTQQLLRERGFAPSPCTPDEYNNGKRDDDDDSSISDMSSISSGEEDEEDEGDYLKIRQYVAEQRKLFSPTPSSIYAYIHRDSMVSRYSNPAESTIAVEEEEHNENAPRGSISTFLRSFFSLCL